MNRQTLAWMGVALLLLGVFALRVYRLNAVDLRGDEAFTAVHWTTTPLTDDWLELIKTEAHPPGAFFAYWGWRELVGESAFALRSLPVFSGVVGAAAAMALARRWLGDWRLVGMAATLWAFNPFLIWHAQDARMYSTVAALTPLTFYWLVRALDQPQQWRGWRPYIVLQTAGIYLYFFEVFSVATQVIYFLTFRQRRVLTAALRAWVMVGALCLPVAGQIYWLMFEAEYQGTAARADLGILFERFIPTLLFGENIVLLGVGLGLFAAFSIGLMMIKRREAWLLTAWVVVPLIALYLAAHAASIFRPRYVIQAIPALILGLLMLGYSIGSRLSPKLGIYVAAGVVAIVGSISAVEVVDYFYNDPPKAPDWEGLTGYLEARTTTHDLVLAGQPDPALEYYYRGPGMVQYIPVDNTNPTGAFADMLPTYDGIFVLSGERTGDATRYFAENAQHIPGDQWPGVVQYRPWTVDAREIQQPMDVQYADVAILRGYTVQRDSVVMLYWEPLRRTEVDHSILLHLEAGDGRVVALDHGVAGAVISTREWEPGVLYRDPVALPVELETGRYLVRVGLYETGNPDNKIPLAGVDAERQYQGRYVIGELSIKR